MQKFSITYAARSCPSVHFSCTLHANSPDHAIAKFRGGLRGMSAMCAGRAVPSEGWSVLSAEAS